MMYNLWYKDMNNSCPLKIFSYFCSAYKLSTDVSYSYTYFEITEYFS